MSAGRTGRQNSHKVLAEKVKGEPDSSRVVIRATDCPAPASCRKRHRRQGCGD